MRQGRWFSGMMRRPLGWTLCCAMLWCCGPLAAQTSSPELPQDFDKSSLTLRTALHYDPSAEVPLQKLLELYRNARKEADLLALYQNHVAQYPQDERATLVLARLYAALNDKRLEEFYKSALSQHAKDPLLAWQHALWLQDRHDRDALPEMARAISLETSASRRSRWLSEMMKAASAQGREDLVLEQVKRLLGEGAFSGEQRLRWARVALSAKLLKAVAHFMENLPDTALSGDSSVDATMLRAELLAANGQADKAGAVLDELLEKLGADYPRRREILMRRVDLATAGEDRDKLVEVVRQRWVQAAGKNSANALRLVDLLEAAQRGQEALKFLQEACALLPKDVSLQMRLMELWEKQGVDDTAITWIKKLRTVEPARGDLTLRELKWLFSAGQIEEAKKGFASLLSSLEAAQQVEQSVELGRWLRRRNQISEAGALLEMALERAPQRWDLRRELAELYFTQQRKEDAARLFTGDWSKGLPADACLEITQFLLTKQLWLDAKRFLEPWLAEQRASFDGQLLLAKILDKIGEDQRMTEIMESARSLCDTDTRYQAWLDTAVSFAESREQTAIWIEKEAARLTQETAGNWTEAAVGRWLGLVSQATAHKEDALAETLLGKLADTTGITDAKRIEIEQMKLALLVGNPARAVDAERGYLTLIEKQSTNREDNRIRLALLYVQSNRHDLARPLLEKLEAVNCQDVTALRGVISACMNLNLPQQAVDCAERLTRLEPAEKAHWPQWLSLLAQTGDEEKLRVGIHEAMSRTRDWNLKPEVLDQLRQHLASSQWRSIVEEFSKGKEGYAAARRIATEMAAFDLASQQRHWLDWLVALLSLRLGDDPAVLDAKQKLAKLDDTDWLPFPDGMELSVRQAKAWLEADAGTRGAAPITSPSVAPLPPFETRWGFSLEPDRILTKVLLDENSGVTVISDDRKKIHAVDIRTGKLRWTWQLSESGAIGGPRQPGSRSNLPIRGAYFLSSRSRYSSNQPMPLKLPPELATAEGRVVGLDGGAVVCLDANNGGLLWRSDLGAVDAPSTPEISVMKNRLVLSEGRAVVWQPTKGIVTALDLGNGKALWQTKLAVEANTTSATGRNYFDYGNPYRASVTAGAGKVVVTSDTAAQLSLADGAILWRLTTDETPGFPIELVSQGEDSVVTTTLSGPPQVLILHGSVMLGSNYILPQAMRVPSGQRWAYTTNLRGILQSGGDGKVFVKGDQVLAVSQSGNSFVSSTGLPGPSVQRSGIALGFAGDRFITWQGLDPMVMASRVTEQPRVLLAGESANVSRAETPGSVALRGTRVYASDANRLRAADARSEAVLFDVPLPADSAEWRKSVMPAKPVLAPTVPNLPPMHQQGIAARQTWTSVGTIVNDERGNPLALRESASVVADGVWIFPVSDWAVLAVGSSALQAQSHLETPVVSSPSTPIPANP